MLMTRGGHLCRASARAVRAPPSQSHAAPTAPRVRSVRSAPLRSTTEIAGHGARALRRCRSGPFLVSLHKKGADVHALEYARPSGPLARLPALAGGVGLVAASYAPTPPAMRAPWVYALSSHRVERLQPPSLLAHAQVGLTPRPRPQPNLNQAGSLPNPEDFPTADSPPPSPPPTQYQALAAEGEAAEAAALTEAYLLPVLSAAGNHEAALLHLSRLVQVLTLTLT